MSDEPTDEQKAATAALDDAIKACFRAFLPEFSQGWENTKPEDILVTEWCVLVGSLGNDESQVDFLLPHFPPLPFHHLKGMLVEALDDLRSTGSG